MNNLKYVLHELEYPDDIECFGITFGKNKINETKCYRYSKEEKSIDLAEYSIAVNDKMNRRYYRINSTNYNDYNKNINKFWDINEVNIKKSIVKKIVKLSKCKKRYLRIRLKQLGVSEEGEKIIIKSYFSIRKFNSSKDIKGTYLNYYENADIFKKVHKICHIKKVKTKIINEVANNVEAYGFYPSMIGLNQYKNFIEEKIYFEMFFYKSYLENIYENSLKVIRVLCEKNNIDEYSDIQKYINLFLDKGYFIRGFTIPLFNIENIDVIKIYFAPIKRFSS